MPLPAGTGGEHWVLILFKKCEECGVEKIGLFPLSIVIFPESSLPLHVFEPRYKRLVNEALNDNLTFGINLVDAAQLYPTGCTVEITDVFRRYPDGRMDVAVTGRKRYSLRTLHEGDAPYYTGIVDYFDDESEEIDLQLHNSAIELYNELVAIVYPHSHSDLVVENSTFGAVSFFMAQKAGLDVLKKQELLEMKSENKRLKMLHEFFEGLLPDLRRKQKIQQVIMNDGYLPPPGIGNV